MREIEVLQLISDGLVNREIGQRLFLSEETVKSHVRHLLAKLQARSRAHAVAIGFRRGLGLWGPRVGVIIGVGGSGGGGATAPASRVLMLEHAIYSVISPEGAASILWRDSNKAEDAAVALKLTAADLKQLKVIDEIIPEPVGGAHRDRDQVIAATGKTIAASLAALKDLNPEETRRQRREKFLAIGRTL